MSERIPAPTARRLSLYLRELQSFIAQGRETVSSSALAAALGLNGAAVRKDLALLASRMGPRLRPVGQSGVGYDCALLSGRIREVTGSDRQWKAVLVGCGNIGRALLAYGGFDGQGFEIVAVFDAKRAMVGKRLGKHRVQAAGDLKRSVRSLGATIGIIAVPREAAQSVANDLTGAGVQGILNFAPMRLAASESISVVNVALSFSLQQLAFDISTARSKPAGREGAR